VLRQKKAPPGEGGAGEDLFISVDVVERSRHAETRQVLDDLAKGRDAALVDAQRLTAQRRTFSFQANETDFEVFLGLLIPIITFVAGCFQILRERLRASGNDLRIERKRIEEGMTELI